VRKGLSFDRVLLKYSSNRTFSCLGLVGTVTTIGGLLNSLSVDPAMLS
jgi:hypothetical protein